MSGHDAAIRAMDKLFGPIIGITLVLMAVFLPAAFLPGLTGRMYAQFALVIAATALLSAINAATLKPTQSAMWLRRPVPPERAQCRLPQLQRGLCARLEHGYARLIGRMAGRSGLMAVDRARDHRRLGLRLHAHPHRLPAGRGPGLPAGERAAARRRLARAHAEGARQGHRDRAQDAGRAPGHHHRRRVGARQQRAARQCRRRLCHPQGLGRAREGPGPALALRRAQQVRSTTIEEARILVVPPPPIQGVGNAAGVTMQIELRDGSFDLAKLQAVAQHARSQRPEPVEHPARDGAVPLAACRNTRSTSTG